jgi:excisionase family DNA binding protein
MEDFMPEAALTPEKVAQLLSVQPKTVRDWLKRGRIKGFKAGRLWRVREKDLDAFLSQARAEMDRETRVWLEAEMSGAFPPYEWGESGPPKGQPVRYVPGSGLVIEKD